MTNLNIHDFFNLQCKHFNNKLAGIIKKLKNYFDTNNIEFNIDLEGLEENST